MTLKETKPHKKHSAIARPAYGNFGRKEWAILGTPCGAIKALADAVITALAPAYTCGYADAQHVYADEETGMPGRLASGASIEYTDQIQYHQFDFNRKLNSFQFRQLFSEMDAVFVNGNHHGAKAQVVVLDINKKASLQKRLSQLTDVQLFLLADQTAEVFDFIKEALPAWQKIPLCHLDEKEKIIAFFRSKLQEAKPVLNGLVLAGGKSLRMGQDKSALTWHGKEQRYFMADLLQPYCKEVFISCRTEQKGGVSDAYQTIEDSFTGLGPYGAILSAFREQPDAAWLVVACDLPLLDAKTLEYLVSKRETAVLATTFESPHDGMPEPLITIWEPKSYPVLLAFLGMGYTCPRKVLLNNEVSVLKPLQPDALLNVNTPDELEKVKQMLPHKITSA